MSDGEPLAIDITHGHSKDNRHDLKQFMLSIVVNGPSHMPIWTKPQNGNWYKHPFQEGGRFRAVLKNKLLTSNDYLWPTRVPETIDEAKNLVMKPDELIEWASLSDGYKPEYRVLNYGNIERRWLLLYS